jgi:uncharacterized membrane protein
MLLVVLVLAVVVAGLWRRLNRVAAQHAELSSEQRTLRTRLQFLEQRLTAPSGGGVDVPPAPRPAAPPPFLASEPVRGVDLPWPPERPARRWQADFPSKAPPQTPESEPRLSTPPPAASDLDAALETPAAAARWLLEFFTTGNVVAKVGMIIVFFGVAFLLRYAAERGMLPIEYRLMATALGAIALLGIGWHLRTSRPEYAVVLQGGAVGVLYLTIFAAFRLYALLPATLTFALLLIVVAFSALLAVAQNAMSLAVLGTSGGFLAPILASTGDGSHVALFSYYAVLNGGVAGIAWFRSWRFLNWIAFVFTVAIALIWGQQFYRPELLSTTEPFLVFFFLLFVAVAVIFAHRQPPQLRGYIDGSLVFGAPAVAFGMQSALVGDIPFARAYSAAALSALYLGLTRLLWHRDQALRPLAEAFLALAVVFLIIVVPMAFDGHATAAAWALEGAGLVWIGIRQHRWLARVVGVSLLLGGGIAFAVMDASFSATPVLNTRFLGAATIAIGAVVGGRLLSHARETLLTWERPFEWVLLAWGLSWWAGAATLEITDHVPARLLPAAFLLTAAASGCVIGLLARRWRWRAMMLATLPFAPVSWMFALSLLVAQPAEGPLTDWAWAGWAAMLALNYALLWWFEATWPKVAVYVWHTSVAWLVMFVATWSVAVGVRQLVPDASIWAYTVWCLTPLLFVIALQSRRFSPPWPFASHQSPAASLGFVYSVVIPAAPVVAMLLWVVWACTNAGVPAPLPYLPLLNPLELTQTFALVVSYGWARNATKATSDDMLRAAVRPVFAGLVFLALNAVVGRVVHFFLDVPFELDDLVESAVFETGVSILWGAVAGLLMTFARLRLDRPVWMAGAGLLAFLILKLFVVDFSNVGGVARIVSFLVTGLVILLIGYFAPAPPRAATGEQAA